MANVHIFCPLFSLCTSVPVPLVRIVILMRLTIVMLLPHARLALVSLLPVTFVVLQLVILLTMEGIIRWDVRLPPAVVMMTVMVVVLFPVRCSPVVVDLGLVPVGLVQQHASAWGVRVRSVFCWKQLGIGGLLVTRVVLVFVMVFGPVCTGAMVMMMVVVMMMAVSLWLTTKESLLFLCLFLHFLVFLFFLFCLLGMGQKLLLGLLRSFSLGGSRLLAFLFILCTATSESSV